MRVAAWRGWTTLLAGLVLSACSGPGLPASVAKDTKVTVAWSGPLTSTNTASLLGQSPDNLDVASMTRSRFGAVVNGRFAPDTSFGAVKIVDQKPFSVRYDLAEPDWSDGVPLDAADLLLAWIAGSDRRSGFQPLPTGLAQSESLVEVDEFGRAITVSFAQPVRDWNSALEPTVPAHVVGRLAFGVEDPMEAKQRVIEVVRDRDSQALIEVAKAWNEAFSLEPGKAPARELLLSSGPYVVDEVDTGKDGGQVVSLRANPAYVGAHAPKVARIDLVQTPDGRKLEALGTTADVIELPPDQKNWEAIHELERRDYTSTSTNDGSLWMLALRTDSGVFKRHPARAAFLRSVPREQLVKAGAGPWGGAFESSDMLLSAPGGDAAEVIREDAKFKEKLGPAEDPAVELASAGLSRGTPVCVGYDTRDAFAQAAFRALGPGMAEAGWAIRDCGRSGFSPTAKGAWQAMLVRAQVPSTTLELSLLWGGSPALNLTGLASPGREGMIARLDRTTDIYAVRELLAKIERSIFEDAIAVPLAMNPVVVVSAPHVTGVAAQPGPAAVLTSSAAEWSVVPGK